MKATTLQFLIDRHLARRLAQRTGDMKPEGLFLLVQSLLTAALVNPVPVVKHIRKFEYLERQISTQRGLIRPKVISINCFTNQQRQALCRTILAVTVEVAAALDTFVLPDSTTILAALLERWVVDMEALGGKRPPSKPQLNESLTRPAKRFRRDNLPALFPKKKAVPRKVRSKRVHAHREFPDVKKKPITWRPGTRGRPPLGATCGENGLWLPPKGWRVIRGAWHPPIRPGEPLSQSTEASGDGAENSSEGITLADGGEPDDLVSRPVNELAQPPSASSSSETPLNISEGLPRTYDGHPAIAPDENPDGNNDGDGPW